MTNKKQTGLLDHIVNLLQRYEQGEVSSTTKQALDSWIPDIANVKNYPMDEQRVTDARKKVRKHITAHIRHDTKRRFVQPKWKSHLQPYAAAAVLFILLGGGILFFTQHKVFNSSEYGVMADANSSFQTTDAQTKQVTLPDGSRIHLNRGTKISYASNAFNRRQREVWLSGEAFFEVAKNPDKPFIIHTGDMTTTVKGTSFNVKAYSELSEQVISVRTGKVKVTKADGQFVQITPDQKAIFNKITNVLTSGVTDGELAASWRNGNIVFDHADRDEIRLRIRQEFGKDVIIQNNVLSDAHFIASYPAQTNLERIVKTIALTNGVQYSINESHVIFK